MSTFSEIWFYTKLSTSALTNVLRILTTKAPVAHQSARHGQRRSAELTCSSSEKPTSAHPQIAQHNLAASNRRPCPCPSPPSDRTRTPTPRGMLQRCRTERAANLMVSWLRSKGVPPKHISPVRHTRSAQPGSTNLSMPTTFAPIRL